MPSQRRGSDSSDSGDDLFRPGCRARFEVGGRGGGPGDHTHYSTDYSSAGPEYPTREEPARPSRAGHRGDFSEHRSTPGSTHRGGDPFGHFPGFDPFDRFPGFEDFPPSSSRHAGGSYGSPYNEANAHRPDPRPAHRPDPRPSHRPDPRPAPRPDPRPSYRPEPRTHPTSVPRDDALDLYCTLGVAFNASPAQLTAAYEELVKKHNTHQERNRNPANRGKITASMAQVNRAYDVLIDAQKRAHYDATGQVRAGDLNVSWL